MNEPIKIERSIKLVDREWDESGVRLEVHKESSEVVMFNGDGPSVFELSEGAETADLCRVIGQLWLAAADELLEASR